MEVNLSYIISHPKLPNFIMYCSTYILFGVVITCLGPMFPYMAEVEGRNQTQYSFLFTCRAFGFVTGSLLVKFFAHRFSLHHFIAYGMMVLSIFSGLFYYIDILWVRGALIFISSIGGSLQEITVNLAALRAFHGDHTAMWLQMVHGFFGIGGLAGPLAVYIFELKTMTVVAVVSFFVAIGYLFLQSPKQCSDDEEDENSHGLPMPTASIVIMAASFFFTVGQQSAFGGWISSYAVLNNLSSKEHATIYSSLYWISITFFRFAFAAVKGSPSKKVELLALVGVVNSIVSYFVTFYINSELGLFMMAILYGLCNSSLYALLFTVPQEFGYRLKINYSVVFVFWSSLGEGTLAVGVGKFMGWFSYDWLIYGMFFMDAVIILFARLNAQILTEDSKNEKKQKLLNPEQGTEMKTIQETNSQKQKSAQRHQ